MGFGGAEGKDRDGKSIEGNGPGQRLRGADAGRHVG